MSVTGIDPEASHPPLRVIVGITVVLALVFACITAPYYLFGSDSARYVALGRSLANGGGYLYFGQPERYFPPGFPLVLAPVALLLGDSFAPMARWAAIVGAFVFPAAYAFARTRTAALPVALLTISSAGFLDLIIGNPRSEPIYMVGSLGLLAWAHQGADRPARSGRSAGYTAAGTVLLLMSVATRAIGIAAVGAVAMVLLERMVRPDRGSRRLPSELLIPLVAAVVFLVLWFAWTRGAPDVDADPRIRGSYLHHMLLMDPHRPELGRALPIAFLSRALHNLGIQLSHAAELLTQLPWLKPRWFSPFAVAVLGLTLTGLWTEMRRPSRLAAWYFLAYGAILLFWPYDEGTRFLVPILPLLWVFAIGGARTALAAVSAGSKRLRLGLIVVGSICLLGAAVRFLSRRDDFSHQDQAFGLVWLLILGIAVFGWARAAAWTGAASRHLGRATLIGALTLYAAAGVARTVPRIAAQYRGGGLVDPVTNALREASGWITGNTPPGSKIQTSFPIPILFATGQKAVQFPITSSPAQLRQYVELYRPDFLIVLRDTDHPYYQPVDSEKFAIVQALFPGAWREVARLRGSIIYAFR